MKTENYVIESKHICLPHWEVYGFPSNDFFEACADLKKCRQIESVKRFPKKLRLVRVMREIIDPPERTTEVSE